MELYDRLSRARQLLEQRRKIVSDNEIFLKTLSGMPITEATLRKTLVRQKAAVVEQEALVAELERASGALDLSPKAAGKAPR